MRPKDPRLCWIMMIIIATLLTSCGTTQATPQPTEAPPPTEIPTPTVSPLEARAGEWTGKTEFGTFSFNVSPSGEEIVDLLLTYQSGIVSGDFKPKGEFAIPILEGGDFEINIPDYVVFKGQFSEDGMAVTGFWEIVIPMAGTHSEEWTLER